MLRLLFLSLLLCIQFSISGSPPTEEDQPPSEERVALVREGAEGGHVDSMFLMGALYRDGWGVDRDSEQAALWFNLAARQGDGSSAFRHGRRGGRA